MPLCYIHSVHALVSHSMYVYHTCRGQRNLPPHPLDHQLGHTQWNSALKRVVLPSLVSGQQSSMIMSIIHSFMHIYVDQAVI